MEANGGKLDHLWETTEDDAGVRRFTANALEQAPTGSSSGSGTGAYAVTITVTDGTNPLENATVRMNSSIAGNYTATTDVNGEATFSLDAATYDVSITLLGYEFTPTTHEITSDSSTHTPTFSMTETVITPASDPALCTCVLRVVNASGVAQEGTTLTFTVSTIPTSDTAGEWYGHVATATSDASGDIEIELPRTAVVEVTQNDVSTVKEYTIPDATSTTLGSFAAIPT
jgi:hypothetical protein